ncbi:MAG: ParA family protein, partial [Planctomycetaceae bacterium]|nr:ParA family protein [Planctomycetaceae bacterium]
MATYAVWNNKGGVGKSYLTFQMASEYARTHPEQNVLVIDLCPQADASSMLLGGMERGEQRLEQIAGATPRLTIAGYIRERISSPYLDPHVGASYVRQLNPLDHVNSLNPEMPPNLYLVAGDYELELLSSRVRGATLTGPDDAWAKVHQW